MNCTTESPICIDGVGIATPDETLDADTLRQRAHCELLRQAAIKAGLLSPTDQPDGHGLLSEAASAAIETLLERTLEVPEPTPQDCQRHYAAHPSRFTTGERVHARHILFAVTPGIDLQALRRHAEATLLKVRCHEPHASDDLFAQAARTQSNCPSGTAGGSLGWLTAADCAPEFAREMFGKPEVGVLSRLVHSRFGLHVVEVLAREAGTLQPFEAVQAAVRLSLRQQAYVTALRRYLAQLADQATVVGVDLRSATA